MPASSKKSQDPRQLAKWAERYARSRTIPFLVQWALIMGLVLVIGLLAYATVLAYQTKHRQLLWVCMGVIAVTMAALTWLSASRWASGLVWRISQWLYGKEGYAAYSGRAARQAKRAWWVPLAGMGLGVYHLGVALLAGLRHLPMDYIQPFSALYMAPFLGLMIVTQRLGFWAWVWPLLYAAYAVAILAGAPHFTGQWFALDVLVSIFGFGLVSMIVGHAYSRYALYRLKQLAQTGIEDLDNGPPEDDSE